MKRSGLISLALLSAVVLWMLSGAFAGVPEPVVVESTAEKARRMSVQVIDIEARRITRELVVQGELLPAKTVEIKAETASRVTALGAAKGEQLNVGDLIVRLAEQDRGAQRNRALADVANQRLEVDGARRLKKSGLQSKNRVKAAEAALASAHAELTRARLELEYVRVRAPFSGVLESRDVEVGSHVERGDPIAVLVDESEVKAVAQVSQQSVNRLRLGQRVMVRLLDGREAEGKISFIARVGDEVTHSFRVEATVPNEDRRLNAGVSAELRIATSEEEAHFISPAALSLNTKGAVGVKAVVGEGSVSFYPIELVRTESDGVWVSGLPKSLRLITQGQGFVTEGEFVDPRPAG